MWNKHLVHDGLYIYHVQYSSTLTYYLEISFNVLIINWSNKIENPNIFREQDKTYSYSKLQKRIAFRKC